MNTVKRCLLRATVSILFVFLLTGPTLARTTGQLCGVVVDEGGSPLPGVSVTATSPARIGGIQPTETDVGGRFQYPRLAPGNYTVRLELEGFVTQELTEVQVRLDRTTELQVTLPLARFSDEVVVVEATPVVDPQQVSTGQTFTTEYLQEAAIGIDSRQYLGVLDQAAGVAGDGDEGWIAGIRVYGSSPRDNVYLIDGIDTTDPYYRTPYLATFTNDAVREIALHTGGFGAEYGRATGGVVNLVTKSGGNRFAGSIDYRFRDNSLEASGDHYDPDEQPAETADLNVSFGGPLVRDRAWFFGAYQAYDRKTTPTGAPVTQEWDEYNLLGKVTWQVGPQWQLLGKYFRNQGDIVNSFASPLRAAEAHPRDEWSLEMAQAEISGVLSSSLLWRLQASKEQLPYSVLPADGDLETIRHRNLATGEIYGNWFNQLYDETSRTSLASDFSWFGSDLLGDHEVKGGVGYDDTAYTVNSCFIGSGQVCAAGVEGYSFLDLTDNAGENIPSRMLVQEGAGPQEFDGSLWFVYLQDAWRLRPDLTLKLGLRWDRAAYTNDLGREMADLSNLQPRLGVAWDIGGRGRNILRASWGQYMHPSSLWLVDYTAEKSSPQELWLSCSFFLSEDPTECAALSAADGLGYRADPEEWDPAGWFLDPALVFSSSPAQIADDLRPAVADELLVSFERELLHRTSLEVGYIWKSTNNLYDDTCAGNYPVPTPDAECSYYVVANLPEVRQDYRAWTLRLESRALDRLHVLASYVNSESRGSTNMTHGYTGDFDVYPYHFDNRNGFLQDHSRHRVKVNGFVLLPYDFSLAFGGYWRSEFRWTPDDPTFPGLPYGTVFTEPRGSRRGDSYGQLDLQVGKGFRLGPTRLRLFGAVINALDSEQPTGVCEMVTGCGEFEPGEATAWQQPRRYELGVRLEF